MSTYTETVRTAPETRPCDRCGKPLVQASEGWRHVTYARRGEICLHPTVSRQVRIERALRERYGALGGIVV